MRTPPKDAPPFLRISPWPLSFLDAAGDDMALQGGPGSEKSEEMRRRESKEGPFWTAVNTSYASGYASRKSREKHYRYIFCWEGALSYL